ncbi:MAG TPA: UDP-N-acetylmuramoyl-tripeptide--D-alanyl-D-alanine ligase [Egibacteraceae bacterium]|nr:UDP-N-acetylmuramoyl-tripeptide--D-alanyl-D-alanine ligase [Egibacteraceae bacterium]
MIPLTLEQLAEVVGGRLQDGADAARVVGDVVIDSRRATAGALFVALPGEHADGHDYVADAVARGAAGYLADERRAPLPEPGAVLVDDPGDALLGLGAWVRDQVDPRVVAVTGSNGKTTTKDLIAAAVGAGLRTVANEGSYNNELGVPLTCCKLDEDSQVLVTEIGARGIGHIASLTPLVRPDVAVVTTVAGAHLELFKDLDTVARAKGELVESLGPDGVAVLNADDARVAAMRDRAMGRVVTYGVSADADWRAGDLRADELARFSFTARGVRVRCPLPGEHNVGNALAALAVADVLGVAPETAAAGIGAARVSRWRMEVRRTPSGAVILNDAYNANPASMEAALKTLASMRVAGRRWAVLGRMAELGDGEREAHDRIGRLCIRLGVDGLVVVGAQARAIRDAADLEGFYGQGDLFLVDAPAEAAELLRDRLAEGDAVLVKASRSAGLERVADLLAPQGEDAP